MDGELREGIRAVTVERDAATPQRRQHGASRSAGDRWRCRADDGDRPAVHSSHPPAVAGISDGAVPCGGLPVMTVASARRRLAVLPAIVLFAFVILGVRLWYLQVLEGP